MNDTYFQYKRGCAKKWFEDFVNFRRPLVGHTGHKRAAKVAILDTGIDRSRIHEPAHLHRIKGARSFVDATGPEDVNDEAPDSHGSHIAGLILEHAPWSYIYVARVARDDKTLDPVCFSEAIKYAVEVWDVDIISTSLGFKNRYKCIEEAINFATKKGVTIFAAASNYGSNRSPLERLPFPARMSEVICIRSSDGYGAPSGFNPPPIEGDFNFMTLGEFIPTSIKSPDAENGERSPGLTGTSFATPLAAAMAASFIELLLQKPLRDDKSLPDSSLKQHGMLKILARMSESEDARGLRYLRPWDLMCCAEYPVVHNCSKTCRKTAVQVVKALLQGPVPVPKVELPDVPHVSVAEFDSQLLESVKGQCMKETREKVLEDIYKWIDDPKGELVGWLVGKAGSGKSAIARTVSQGLSSKRQLGASFFFMRSHRDCTSAFPFVPSVAHQLSRYRPRLARSVRRVIALDPDMKTSSKGRQVQWEKLVAEPLGSVDTITVIVIDGLDECNEAAVVLSLLSSMQCVRDKVRVLITSGREVSIEKKLYCLPNKPHEFDLDSKAMIESTQGDIERYVVHTLGGLRNMGAPLVNEEIVAKLTKSANGLFNYAKVACGYIRGDDDPRGNQRSTLPAQRLEEVLKGKQFGDNHLYRLIMREATRGPDEEEVTRQLRHVLGVIVAASEPIPESVFPLFCPENLDAELVKNRLDSLWSVMAARETPDQPVQTMHESFREYLVGEYKIDEMAAHENLLNSCMRLMLRSEPEPVLKRDICGLGQLGADVKTITSELVSSCLGPETRYACRYWVDHLEQVGAAGRVAAGLVDNGTIHVFLENHFLNWLEALSLMKAVESATYSLKRLSRMLSGTVETVRLRAFVQDAQHFVRYNLWIIQHWPLQLYASALVFSPARSYTRLLSEHMIPDWISGQPATDDDWHPAQSIESKEPLVAALFAHDSLILATLAEGGVISLWETETGCCRFEQRHESAQHLVFSGDSKLLASASASPRVYNTISGRRLGALGNHHVKVWNVKTGALVWTLGQHVSSITSMAFSDDSRKLASASEDGVIRIWDTDSGDCEMRTSVSTALDVSISFLSNSTSFAAVSGPHVIKTWIRRPDGWETPRSNRIEGNAQSVVFSGDGRHYAVLFSKPNSVEIREHETGKCLKSLGFKDDRVGAVTFSSSGMVAFTSGDLFHGRHFIHVWSITKSRHLWKLKSDQWQKGIAFSRDSKLLASAHSNGVVRVWDMDTGKCSRELRRGKQPIKSISFSYDSKVLAIASRSRALDLWNLEPTHQLADGATTSSFTASFSSAISSVKKMIIADTTEATGKRRCYHTKAHEDPITSLYLSKDAEILVSASDGKENSRVDSFNVAKNQCLWTLNGHRHAPVAFSRESGMLALASSESSIEIINISTGRRHGKELKLTSIVSPMALSPSGNLLAFSKMYQAMEVWDRQKHTTVPCEIPANHVKDVAFSYDDKMIAAALRGRKIMVMDIGTRTKRKLRVHESQDCKLVALAYSQDSKRLSSSLDNGEVYVWDLSSGECHYRLRIGSEAVRTMCFNSTSSKLVTEFGTVDIAEANLVSPSSPNTVSTLQPRGYGISLDKSWITRDAKESLWLPPEYRPVCSVVSEPTDHLHEPSDSEMKRPQTLAIGCKSGKVLVFTLLT